MQPGNRFFGVLIGPSGSGTTLLLRLLSHAAGAVSLGGNHQDWPETENWGSISRDLLRATELLWDRKASEAQVIQARRSAAQAAAALRQLPSSATHVFFKRSSPFLPGSRYRPDLLDIAPILAPDALVLILRQPQACAVSTFRRGHHADLRVAASLCAEHLSLLASQWAALPEPRPAVIDYDRWIQEPGARLERLADLCRVPVGWLETAAEHLKLDASRLEAWRSRVDAGDRAMLEAYFSPQRCRQWAALTQAAQQF